MRTRSSHILFSSRNGTLAGAYTRTCIVAFVLGAVLVPAGAWTESTVEQEVLAANRLLSKATGNNDLGLLEQLWSDDYILTDRLGRVWTKAQQIENFKSSTLVYERLSEDDIRVKVYGGTAVVTGRTDQRVRFASDVSENRTRYTRVYVKHDGRWQIVATQRTDIATPK
jgi:hypothetical protein